MKLLEFLPGIAQNTQARFNGVIYPLVCYSSSENVYVDTYLIIYSNEKVRGEYHITSDIKLAFGYVAEYGKDCQVMRLRVDNEPIVELLY